MCDVLAVLAKYPPDCRSTDIEPLGFAGGMSGAQFWRVACRRGVLILRRWPIEHPTPARLAFIHAVLHHAAAHGCDFLPLPITTPAGETFITSENCLWELQPWMPGAANYNQAPSVEKLHSAMRALAQFHIAVADFTPHPTAPGSAGGSNAIQRHLARLQELTPARVNDLSNAIRDWTWPGLAPLAHQFVAQLPRAVHHAIANLEPLANAALPVQPCIRDIWHDHILFTGDAVTGIIDFGAVDVDTPATDIARLLGSFTPESPLPFREGPGEGSPLTIDPTSVWTEGLAAYQTVRPLSHQEIETAHALNISGTILAGCNWIRWIYIDGRQFANQGQVIERFRRICTATSKFGQLRLS